MKKNITVIPIILFIGIVVVVFFLTYLHSETFNKNVDNLTESELSATANKEGFTYKHKLTYSKEDTKTLEDGMLLSSSSVISPVGAKIVVDTLSKDNVQVTGMWQDGEKTYMVVEPVAKNKE